MINTVMTQGGVYDVRLSNVLSTGTIYNGTVAVTPKYSSIAISSSGNNTIVSAVTGKKLRVLSYKLSANGAVNAKWLSGTTTDLTGFSYFASNSLEVAPFNPIGWFETSASALLTISLSGSVAVGGHMTYIEV